MTIPHLPDVKAAAWRHPYRFSGRLPLLALLLMVSIGLMTALIAGVGGYFGGAVAHWIEIQTGHLATAIVKLLGAWGYIGKGVGMFIVFFPTLIIGFCYPLFIGGMAGGGVAIGARIGKCRMPYFAGLLGFLAGAAAYATFVGTMLFMEAPLHVSSRILPLVGPPLSYGLMVVDCLIVLIAATLSVRSIYKTPFCESCRKWFDFSKKLTMPVSDAAALVEALASRSALPLQGVPDGTRAPARIQLDLSHCKCGQSDYNLVAVLNWNEASKGKVESKTQAWFSTTLPASLGAEIEGWSSSTQLPAAVQPQTQTPTQERSEQASPPAPRPQEAIPLRLAERPQATAAEKAAPSPVDLQPAEQAPGTEICKRCGSTINSSTNANYTCPYCGHTHWGTLIGCGTFSLALTVGAVLWGLHISASFLRLVVVWGGGILGGMLLLVVIAWIIKGIRTPLKPLSEVARADKASSAPEPAVELPTPPS